jgi:FHS family L-fucose permease-like MFS transporter
LAAGTPHARYGKSLALLASLFFMWGFITVINNTLLPHLRSVFDLNYTQTTLIESVWFIAYGVASIPSAFLIERVGYKKAIITVSGTTLEGGAKLSAAQRLADAQATQLPYILVAVVLVLLAFVISRANLPALGSAAQRVHASQRTTVPLWKVWAHPIFKHRNLAFGVPAIFIYLIAEIGVANLFINFVSQPSIGNMTHSAATTYLTLLWGGMMVGRFAGAFIMRRAPADKTLAVFALFAMIVMIAAATLDGPAAMWALILVGLGHSIMFPTIFALGIKGLGPLTEEGSGLLIMAIAGGALVIVQGWLADTVGLQNSFWLTVACEVYIIFYALWGSKPTRTLPAQELA